MRKWAVKRLLSTNYWGITELPTVIAYIEQGDIALRKWREFVDYQSILLNNRELLRQVEDCIRASGVEEERYHFRTKPSQLGQRRE